MNEAYEIALEHAVYCVNRGDTPADIARSVGSEITHLTADHAVQLLTIKWMGLNTVERRAA